MKFDRSSILSDAHAQARKLLTYGCFRGTYRQALSAGLRLAWHAAKEAVAEAEWQALQPPISADVSDRVREMREEAWLCPINRTGNDCYAALLAQAQALHDAARGLI